MKSFHEEPEEPQVETHALQEPGQALADPGSYFSIPSSKKCFASSPSINYFLKGPIFCDLSYC